MKQLDPKQAYAMLKENPDALFIDCRSDTEHFFVGHPSDSVHVAWQDGPEFEINPNFVGEVRRLAGHTTQRPIILICRSGRRSIDAAHTLEQSGFTNVHNVVYGFEGELNEEHHRSSVNGWRHAGLPWQQL